MRVQIAVFLALVLWRAPLALAGAWTLPPGRSLAILKSESVAKLGPAPGPITQQTVSLFVERGLSSDLSLELKTGVQTDTLRENTHTGLGEQAVGLKYRVGRWRNVIVSGYLGERVLFDPRGDVFSKDHPDWRMEARGLVGSSFRLLGRDAYLDLEATTLYGGGARRQNREDASLGLSIDRATTLTLSRRSGQDERKTFRSVWTTLEATAVRKFGRWRIEGGWKETVISPWTTYSSGPIVAVWRSF